MSTPNILQTFKRLKNRQLSIIQMHERKGRLDKALQARADLDNIAEAEARIRGLYPG